MHKSKNRTFFFVSMFLFSINSMTVKAIIKSFHVFVPLFLIVLLYRYDLLLIFPLLMDFDYFLFYFFAFTCSAADSILIYFARMWVVLRDRFLEMVIFRVLFCPPNWVTCISSEHSKFPVHPSSTVLNHILLKVWACPFHWTFWRDTDCYLFIVASPALSTQLLKINLNRTWNLKTIIQLLHFKFLACIS